MNAISDDMTPTARLNRSRRQLQDLFDDSDEQGGDAPSASHFPRSKIMQMFTRGRGLTLIALGAGGFLMFKRPALLMSALRVLPMGTVMRMIAMKFMMR